MIKATRKDETLITVKSSIFHQEGLDHDILISTDGGTTFDNKGTFDSNQLASGVDIICPAGNIQVKTVLNYNQDSEERTLTSHVV